MAHVLILSLVFRPDNVSTAQLMADLADDLKSHGHSVTILTTTPHYNPAAAAEAEQPLSRCWGFLLQRSTYKGANVFHVWMPAKGRNKLYRILTWLGFHLISTLAGVCKVRRPDVILSPSPPLTIGLSAWILATYHRCSFIYNVQEIYPDVAVNLGVLRSRLAINVILKVEQFVYRKAAIVTVISERMEKRLREKKVPESKLVTIPNFVDVGGFKPLAKDNAFSRKHALTEKFVISYAGNMGKPQHLETLLQAASLLLDQQRLQFVMMGDGSEYADLREMARVLRLTNMTFLPYQPYALMPLAYASVDASYVPQALGTSSDGVPSKVYRIMAAGRPVIACTDADSDLAGLISRAEAGVVVTSSAPAALADEIAKALADEGRWAQFGANGRKHVLQHYERGAISARYERLIRRLTEN